MLDKALVKFPVGVPRRWEQVTQYVRTRTQDEIVFMVKVRSFFTPEQEVTGEIARAQSCIANRTSTLTRAARQHHQDS